MLVRLGPALPDHSLSYTKGCHSHVQEFAEAKLISIVSCIDILGRLFEPQMLHVDVMLCCDEHHQLCTILMVFH